MRERRLRDSLDLLCWRHLAHDAKGAVRRFDALVRRQPTVDETRRMPQQILNSGRSVRFDERVRRLAVSVLSRDRDLKIGELREIFRDGIGERQLALLSEHHRGNRYERLCHRIETKDGVPGHRRAACRIALSERLEVRDLAFGRTQAGGAGEWFIRVLCLDRLSEPLEPLRGEADLLRLGSRKRLGERDRNAEEGEKDGKRYGEWFHGVPPWL